MYPVVDALREDAHNVVHWPFERNRLMPALTDAARASAARATAWQAQRAALQLVRTLSAGERQVLDLLLAGATNKNAAAVLGVALRTVEDRRKKACDKLRTRSLAQVAC